MNYTNDQIANMNCFGKDFPNGREQIVEAAKNSFMFEVTGFQMIAMSILSDAQHVLENGDAESARQKMNIAKVLISASR